VTEIAHHQPITIVSPTEVAIGESQVLVVSEIPLNPAARRIIEVIKNVEITQCKVINNKVIINGILEKIICFLNMGALSPISSKKPSCGGEQDQHMTNRVAHGDCKATLAQLPFALFVDVPGAQPGDECLIEVAEVVGEKEEPMQVQSDGSFRVLLEKTVVRVVAKVVRTKQIPIRPEWPK